MVNTEIRLIIFFAAKDDESLYSQPKMMQPKMMNLYTVSKNKTGS